MMKHSFFRAGAGWLLAAVCLLAGCSDDPGIDNRDAGYGYVQFKLFKRASYEPAAAGTPAAMRASATLDYLGSAAKIRVALTYGETTLTQNLVLEPLAAGETEYGLGSAKLKLLTGFYQVVRFELYDALDALIYSEAPQGDTGFEIVEGGLALRDLAVDVRPRGQVRFTLVKNFDGFSTPDTRAEEYTFDEITEADIEVYNPTTSGRQKFSNLKPDFSVHFDPDNESNGTPGYQTSSAVCDTLLSIEAGEYRLLQVVLRSKQRTLATLNYPAADAPKFTVRDNARTDVDVPVKMNEQNEYIQDYYALYEIWKSLDGEHWQYAGVNYPKGANWDFNKDPDLWGDQPGVGLHDNGRVAKIDISEFGFRGELPDAIGQLTELVELYLGTHNDANLIYDPTLDTSRPMLERTRNRMENHKEYMASLHPRTPLPATLAQGLRLHNDAIPETKAYDGIPTDELFRHAADFVDPATGAPKLELMDMHHGKLQNGLTKISEEIGKLTKLVYFNVANSTLEALPDAMRKLVSCTDFELYNCPNMKKFPTVVAEMPALVSVNLANNAQWEADDLCEGLRKMAEYEGRKETPTIQILYLNYNNLEKVPEEFAKMKKIGLLDLSHNKIREFEAPLGREVSPVQLYLDYNELQGLPVDEERFFCGYEDMETFSCTHNHLELMPNIFSAKSRYGITSADFSYNDIHGFEGAENNGYTNGTRTADEGYRGIYVQTLTLACNPITEFPRVFGETSSPIGYIVLRGCEISEFPKGALGGKYTSLLLSLDLSYNHLSDLPDDFSAENLPYLYGVELSHNRFSEVPLEPLNSTTLTIYAVRGQRDEKGGRCLKTWPSNLFTHTGLRAFFIGSNDIRKVDETVSTLIYNLDIADNPNIYFDASDVCAAWQAGVYYLYYDKTQQIVNCDAMLD